jgi:O-antigen/teichoic acid export membrane protein
MWIERLLRALAVCGVLAAALLYTCADLLVKHVLGPAYAPVAGLLPVLALAGLASGPGSIARVLLVSHDLGAASIHGAAVQLGCFAALGVLLIPGFGSLGACLAVTAATIVFSLYSTWSVQGEVRYSLRPWVWAVLLGAACSPALWAWSGFGPLRLALFVVVYLAAAMALGSVRLSEGRLLVKALRRGA